MPEGDCCFICNECPASFRTLDALVTHLPSHAVDRQLQIKEEPPMDDRVDNSPSSSAVAADSPADSAVSMNAAGMYACRFCSRQFETRDQLNVHLTHTHRDKPQYVCEVCDAVFAVKRELSTHARVHSGEQPHQCEQCDKQFGTRQLLKKHYMWHTGKRSHVCKRCNKGFFQKGHLTQHLMIHGGRRPFGCTLCEKTFIFKFDLNRHMKIHAERGFCCSKCSKSFATQSELNEHACKKTTRKAKTNESPLDGIVGSGTPPFSFPNSNVSLSPEAKREPPTVGLDAGPFTPEHVAQMAQVLMAQQQQQRLFALAQEFLARQPPTNGHAAPGLSPLQLTLLLQQRQAAQQLQPPQFAQFPQASLITKFESTPSPATAEEPPAFGQPELRPLDLVSVALNGHSTAMSEEQYEISTSSSCASSPRKVSPMIGGPVDVAALGLHGLPMLDSLKLRSKCATMERELTRAHEQMNGMKEFFGRFSGGIFSNGSAPEAAKFGPPN